MLVSHDWGGVLGFLFAAKYQDMVDKLIVMNAPHVATMESYLKGNFQQAKKSWYALETFKIQYCIVSCYSNTHVHVIYIVYLLTAIHVHVIRYLCQCTLRSCQHYKRGRH